MTKKTLPAAALPASLDGLTGRFAGYTLPQAEQYFSQYPGAAPGGTGETGLASNDAQGYSDLLNLRTSVLKAKNPQTTVRTVDGPSGLAPSIADNPLWWTGGGMATTPDDESSDESAMPSALRPLYRKSYLSAQK